MSGGRALAMGFAALLLSGTAAGAPRIDAIHAARTSGLAPLAVVFDATGTTDSRFARAFHALRYEWDFDDPGSGTWSLTGKSRNRGEGPVTGHVFTVPGSYDVGLLVTNPEGETATSSVRITVEDPDLRAWSGAYCYSNGSDHTGCPAGFTRVSNVSSYAETLQGRLRGNSAHLFHRGHSFQMREVNLLQAGDVGTISAYGSGPRPVLTGARFWAADDWRVAHLDLRGGATIWPFDNDSFTPSRQFTVFDVIATGYAACFDGFLQSAALDHHEQTALVDFTCQGLDPMNGIGWITFLSVRKSMLLGLDIEACSSSGRTEGNLRFVYANTVVLSHSRLTRGCSNDAAKNALHIRSCGQDNAFGRCAGGGHPNQYIVVSDNVFENWVGGSIVRTCTHDECDISGTNGNLSRDLLLERNFAYLNPGGPRDAFRFLSSQSGDVTVRNNVVDLTSAQAPWVAFVEQSSAGSSDNGEQYRDNLHVYNNTFVLDQASGKNVRACYSAIGSSHECKNNLIHAPGANVTLTSGSGWDGEANLYHGGASAQSYLGYPFIGGSHPGAPSRKTDFRLASSGVTGGTSPRESGVLLDSDGLDASGACRAGAWDVGAYELNAQVCPGAGTAASGLDAPELLPPTPVP